ncbi:hypothetical protein RUM43_006132 [Polyplax serrata]|uniref:asparagine--tRNA ligase n=1 Tax=Polyplax serrata TaxID=468196 RepID=A0AAN8NSM9_POLSC
MSSIHHIMLTKPLGTHQTVKGWVKAVRRQKKNVFIDVSDGSCNTYLQILMERESCPWPLQWGTSLEVTGEIKANSIGQLELLAHKINVIGNIDIKNEYPFTPKQKESYETYRQHLHLRPKIEFFTSMFRFRSAATHRIHQYFADHNFVAIHTPIITSNDCEGAGETFAVQANSKELLKEIKKDSVQKELNFFDSPAFLTVSGQLHLESAARGCSRVYTFNPCFRAENSNSRLHLSEFYMIEAEESFVSDIKCVLERIEGCLKDVISFLVSNNLSEIEYILKHNETDDKQHLELLSNVINKPFTVMTFSEAKSFLSKNKDKLVKSENYSPHCLSKEEELFLVSSNNNIPVFVVEWPKFGKPFYMKECLGNPDLVNGVDLLVPNVGELCGGSLREDNYDRLKKKLTEADLLEKLQWYADLRKFGDIPTGGFGMGFERFLQFLLNVGNIKDTIPFPRWTHRLQL